MNLFDRRNNLVFRDYLRILYKRKWWGVVPLVVTIAVGLFLSTLKKPTYKSTTLLRIAENQEFSISLKKLMPSGRGKGTDIKQIAKELTSSRYIVKLIERLKLKPDEKLFKQAQEIHAQFPEKNIDEIMRELQVDKIKRKIYAKSMGTSLIEIGVTSQDPDRCYLAAKTLVDIFIEEAMKGQMKALKHALKFSDDQIAYYKQKLETAQKRLEELNKTISVQKVDNEGLDQAAIDRIEEALATVDIRIDELNKQLQEVESEIPGGRNPGTPPERPTMTNLQQKIYNKINRTALLMNQFSWKDPQIIQLNRDIDGLRELWEAEISKSYRVILSGSDLKYLDKFIAKTMVLFDLDVWNHRKEALQTVMDEHKKYVAQGPVQQQDLTKLQDEVDQMKTIYNSLIEQSQGTQLKEAMQQADLGNRYQILEPARKPVVPLSAGSNMMLALTGMMALAFGFGSIFLVEFLDNSVRTVEEAEKEFNIPVIGVVPNLQEKHNPNHKHNVRVIG
ncbi:MAG: GumC family protein [bacterium]